MGISVTVDSDDLQTLLFATAAIKGVENALRAQAEGEKYDPLMAQAKARFTEASDNIARAWRATTRRISMPSHYRDPTPGELQFLNDLFFDRRDLGETGPVEWFHSTYPRGLVTIGMVELGNERDLIIWPDESVTSARKAPRVFARLTQRGKDALMNALMSAKPPTPDAPAKAEE